MRTYIRKNPDYARTPPQVMRDAVRAVASGMSEREASRSFNIPKTTLRNNIKKSERLGEDAVLRPNFLAARIFNDEQEKLISDYITACAKMFHGLTITQFRSLAFELAIDNNMNVPGSWRASHKAGLDWYRGFMNRHKELSIRMPEATSLGRASAFNRHNIGAYFDLLEDVITTLQVANTQVYNLDETGVTTVHTVQKVISPRGVKQLGKVTSHEKGERVTMCCAVSASGHVVPPFYVFPRKIFKKNIMMHGSPEGSEGDANPSGWMSAGIFLKVMEHFIKSTRPSAEHPIVLTMDNHESHIDYKTIEMAKRNHVHILTLPPHTSNKTQPLDRTVFGPMKRFFNKACDSWMRQHPGRPLSIYELAGLGGDAFMKAASFSNVSSGFRVSGIWPFNRYVFEEDDYLPAFVTDRPEPINESAESSAQIDHQPQTSNAQINHQPQTSNAQINDQPQTSNAQINDQPQTSNVQINDQPQTSNDQPQTSNAQINDQPETSNAQINNQPQTSDAQINDRPQTSNAQINDQPHTSNAQINHQPQTSNAKINHQPQTSNNPAAFAPSSSTSFTVTPAELFGYAKAPPRKASSRGRKRGKAMIATSTPELQRIKESSMKRMKMPLPRNSSTKRGLFVATQDQDSDSDSMSISECCRVNDDSMSEEENVVELGVVHVVHLGDHVLVEYGDKGRYYYVGIVTKEMDEDEDVEVDFFRKKGNHFVKPAIEDKCSVHMSEIKAVLPNPAVRGTTQRTQGEVVFSVDFGNLAIR